MFNIFEFKNRCLGVDLGTTGVKIVEIKKEGNIPLLVNYVIIQDEGSLLHSQGFDKVNQKSLDLLTAAFKKGNFNTKRVVAGIPGFLSLITFIDLPEMPEEELNQAIRFEAAKYIPTPIEEVSLGWEIVGSIHEKEMDAGSANGAEKKLQIMVVTVPKVTIDNYGQLFKKEKMHMAAIEVENFATARCLIGNDKGNFLIVNIGGKATEFTLVHDGIVRVTRSIDVGGIEISRAIAGGFDIDSGRAEQMKKSGKFNLLEPNDGVGKLVKPVLGMIIDEIRRLRDAFEKKDGQKIEKVIITGGTAKMAQINEYFSRELETEVQSGNPLSRVGIERKYQKLFEDLAHELTVAIGLAMRGLG